MGDTDLQEAIFIENKVDLGRHNAEVYMRFQTDLDTGTTAGGVTNGEDLPTFYTDQNGLTMEKRVKVERIRIEGNYYPVNTMAFIQDEDTELRFSVLVDRSHGFSSFEYGRIETLVERRTVFDDSRGMGEGVTDNRPTISNYVLLLEKVNLQGGSDYRRSLPTMKAQHFSQELIYQPSMFIYNQLIDAPKSPSIFSLFSQPLPCDAHVLNLRTMSRNHGNLEIQFPTEKALLVLQKFAFNCKEGEKQSCGNFFFYPDTRFNRLRVGGIERTDLTGIKGIKGGNFSHLHQVLADPFDITSVVVTFA